MKPGSRRRLLIGLTAAAGAILLGLATLPVDRPARFETERAAGSDSVAELPRSPGADPAVEPTYAAGQAINSAVGEQLSSLIGGSADTQKSEASESRPLAEVGPETPAPSRNPDEPKVNERYGPTVNAGGDADGGRKEPEPAPMAPNGDNSPLDGDASPSEASPEPRIPGLGLSFNGISYTDPGGGVWPPDPTGAVGPNHYVQATNESIAIYNKSGGVLGGPWASSSIWSGFSAPCGTSNQGDVIVLYDRFADRWFFAEMGFTRNTFTGKPQAPFYQCVAVSSTSSPLGSWHRYQFISSTGYVMDYPKFGVWPDGYYMSANLFDMATSPPAHRGVMGGVMERSKMLAGLPAQISVIVGSPVINELMPADIDGSTLPPPGVGDTFVAIFDDSIGLPWDAMATYRYNVNWANPSAATITLSGVLQLSPFNSLVCPTDPYCASQPGTAQKLDVVSGIPMFRAAYRNFGSHESLLVNHTIDVGGGRPGVRWYEVRGVSGATSLYQQGNHAPGFDGHWLGSMASDGAGGIALGTSFSSLVTFPSIGYTGRIASDPLGTMAQGYATLMAGSGSQTTASGRWGDYSQMSVDPVDDCTFWYTNEYQPFTTTVSWRTRVGKFALPGCTTAPPNAPTNVATRAEDEQVALFWDNPLTATAGVRIVRKVGPAAPTAVTDGITVFDGYAATYTDVGLTNGTQYSYGLFAHSGLPAYSVPATSTETPATHSGPAYTAYLSEGYTGSAGFLASEYLTLGNPDPATPSTVIATYLIEDAAPVYKTYIVAPSSRLTVFVNNEIGAEKSNGTRLAVKSGPGLVAERPMYFSGSPGVANINGGHDSVASPKPRANWYFAEGYTGTGFVEYLTLLNPSGETSSNVQATYVFGSGAPIVKSYSVAPGQRFTINVVNEVGAGRDVSTHLAVTSGPPIVAERPMYFNANPLLGAVVNDGHVYMGAPAPATTWYFAEGYTGAGFVEWLTLQNANGAPSEVTATYAFTAGPPLIKNYVLAANSRTSLLVNNEIGAPGRDVAVRLDSSTPIVAERPMYFKANPALGTVVDGGHDVVGATSTGATNVLAEGYTGAGFVEWLTLQNPTAITSTIDITYLFNSGAPIVETGRVLLPNSRTTIRVNSVVGDGREVSVKIQTTWGSNPIVERPMYFSANPALGAVANGGHDVVASTLS